MYLKILNKINDLYFFMRFHLAWFVWQKLKNQFINNTSLFDEIFIHPSMGDGGLALGAALCKSNELGELPTPVKLDNVFFGSQF